MKDALDKALESHKLNVDVTDTFTVPHMKWLYKHPTKKINKQRLDSQQVSPILRDQMSIAEPMSSSKFPALSVEKKSTRKANVYPKYLKNNRTTLNKFMQEN